MCEKGWGGGWAAVYRAEGKERLLSRGSASWVCCWPDQLAVCLAGVWHITTKGFGQTAQLLSTPQFESICIFPPPFSVAYPAECKAQIWRYGSFRKVICNITADVERISLHCVGTLTGFDLENFCCCCCCCCMLVLVHTWFILWCAHYRLLEDFFFFNLFFKFYFPHVAMKQPPAFALIITRRRTLEIWSV